MKRVLSGQAEPEMVFVTQHSFHVRKRRKPEGKRKGYGELHILSIYPATVQKLRNLL